jgi:DNA-binding PadR family transcriptional regulator
MISHLFFALISGYAGFIALCIVFEPSRKRRVLESLRNHPGWTSGLELSKRAKVRAVYVTLASLEDEGLIERQTEEKPAESDRFFLPRSCYRLTDGGRAASNIQSKR